MVPSAISQARTEHKDIRHEQARTKEINRLSAFITALGGPKHVETCGRPVLNVEYVSIMAWYMHRNTGTIGYRPQIELRNRRYPIVRLLHLPQRLGGARPYRTPARPEEPLREPQRPLRARPRAIPTACWSPSTAAAYRPGR